MSFVAEPAANLVSRIILERRRDDAASTQGVRARGVPGVDRRALPPGVSLERAGRHAVHRRHVSRRHPAARRHHGVPAATTSSPTSSSSRPGSAASTASSTRRRRAIDTKRMAGADVGAAGRDAVASQRLVARYRAAAARRAWRQVGRARISSSWRRARPDWRVAAARALDAGRDRRHRAVDSCRLRSRILARRAHVGDPAVRALARAGEPSDSGRRAQTQDDAGLVRCGSSSPRRSAHYRPGRGRRR